MPTLLELQRDMRAHLIERVPTAIAEVLAAGVGTDRLDIYRNTIYSGLTKALRLAFPAVERLVGADFFDGASDAFIEQHPPRTAYLNQYGSTFPDFLSDFPPATSLPYLAEVARLEWAVNCALHAPDESSLEISKLGALVPEDQGRVVFRAHPSVSLLRGNFPVDIIWRAVLAGDDRALSAVDLNAGPAFLLVERSVDGVEVGRLDEPSWRFLDALCRGEALALAVGAATDVSAPTQLAGHLAAGRFSAFSLSMHEQTLPFEAA